MRAKHMATDRISDGCLAIVGTCFAALLAIFGYQWNNDGWLRSSVMRPRDLGVQYQKAQKSRAALAKKQVPAKADEATAESEAAEETEADALTHAPR